MEFHLIRVILVNFNSPVGITGIFSSFFQLIKYINLLFIFTGKLRNKLVILKLFLVIFFYLGLYVHWKRKDGLVITVSIRPREILKIPPP